MYKLVVSFQNDDLELKKAIDEQFGSDLYYEEEKGFDGWDVFLTVVIPVAEFSLSLLTFIITYFCSHDTDKKRVIIEPDGRIDLTGYSGEEAEKILRAYFESQIEKNDKQE